MLNDQQLGKRLVEAGKVTEAALSAALAEQKRLIMEGRAARLGELLVQRGLCAAADVQEALAGQGKKIGECDACGARFNVVAWAPNRLYRCGKCQGVLRPVEVSDDVAVSGTKVMPAVGAPPPAAKAKQKLGNITLMRELGRGGMGVVYQGVQEELRRTVAVKVLLNSDDAKLKARFLREARVVSKLRHPNIVGVHELGEADGKAYFTMDYIEGGPLNALFSPERLPVKELGAIVATIARAMDYAHRQGLVHRDIKPQNILVSSGGVPFLSDFGLAREIESSTRLTMSGAVMGTPSYMSPEQARGEGARVDARSDLYSLGAVLYEGLTGRPPFDGKDLISMLDAIIKDEPVAPSKIAAGIPPDLETICLKALDKSPEKRFQSGEEFAADLDRFLKGEAISARRSGAIEKGARWARKRPALVASVGAAFSVALVAGIVIWRGHVNAEVLRKQREKESAEAAERDRIAKEERARYELRLRELEDQLSRAKTDEDKERILREIEAAKGGPAVVDAVKKPVDPPVVKVAWAEVEARIALLLADGRSGDALAALEEFQPTSEEGRQWKKKEQEGIEASIDGALAKIVETAAGFEAAGDMGKAIEAWKAVPGWNVARCTQRAEAETARIEGLVLQAAREAWRKDRLPALRRAIGAAMEKQDFDGARDAIDRDVSAGGADDQEVADLRWNAGQLEQFWSAFRTNAVDKDVDTFKHESAVKVVSVLGDGRLSVTLRADQSVITTTIALADIRPASLVDTVRKSGGDEDSIALFWWFYAPPVKKDKSGSADPKDQERADREVEKNRKRALEMAGKSQNSAKLLAFLNGLSEDGATPDPADPGVENPAGALRGPWAVDGTPDPKFGVKWSYRFASAAEAGDWLIAPRGPMDRLAGWGAHLDKNEEGTGFRLWTKDAMAGWTGSTGRIVRIRAQATLVDAPDGRFGIMLGGFQAWVAGGERVWTASPTGKSLGGNHDLGQPAMGRPVVLEMWLEDASVPQLHVLVDGKQVQQVSIEEAAGGPTGVYSEGGAVAQWDWIEVSGRVEEDASRQIQEFRTMISDARAAASPAKLLSDGKSMGAFQSLGGGSWAASGGHLRGKSAGSGPRQEAIVRTAGARNFRLRLRYWGGSAQSLVLEVRGSPGTTALRFMLPLDKPEEWRDVEVVAAERCVWCTIDDALPLFLVNPPEGVSTGEIAVLLFGGEAAIDDVALQEVQGLAEDSGPSYPWPPMPGPGGGPGPGPGPGPDGWSDLWDRKSTEGFARKEKLGVKNGELQVATELTTLNEWPAVELEMEFAVEMKTGFQVGAKQDWVAKVEVLNGKHRLWLRITRAGVEMQLDGRPMTTKGGSGDKSGPFRIRMESGVLKIISLRHRPPPP